MEFACVFIVAAICWVIVLGGIPLYLGLWLNKKYGLALIATAGAIVTVCLWVLVKLWPMLRDCQ